MGCRDTREKSSIRRKDYKELMDIGSQIESTVENTSAVQVLKKIFEITKRADDIKARANVLDHLENTSEVVMDAQVLKMAHELVGSVVQTMEITEISDEEFVVAINRKIGNNKDWNKLADVAVKMSRTVTRSQPLFGTFDEESVIRPKEVKERRKNTTLKNTRQVQPAAVVKSQKEQQEAQTVNVLINQIVDLYKENNNEPLPYYKLIIDPENFMRTIHNAFNVSFLFRDGAIVIEEDEFKYPTVRPTRDSDKEGTFDERNHQMVANLTTTLCDEMIQRYHITEAMITWSGDDE